MCALPTKCWLPQDDPKYLLRYQLSETHWTGRRHEWPQKLLSRGSTSKSEFSTNWKSLRVTKKNYPTLKIKMYWGERLREEDVDQGGREKRGMEGITKIGMIKIYAYMNIPWWYYFLKIFNFKLYVCVHVSVYLYTVHLYMGTCGGRKRESDFLSWG